ncbi:hypothetical protein Lp90_0792 [Lactiplantibacillus plantarum]|uniref:DUF2335 domain-containing protein n=1 Tax=Lactiplantibacillus plantarum TaxID=1590 RepID=UPI0004DCB409|nr:DUF2335 domain-containing protein [Lactiplantibacillus plantarum]KEZ15350.1 hypothetical protein Lp90_0792 [Lactiplantibacillus plantarum]MCL3857647.1 DUF2335 domain-containing protein [Lactiplantibacillus plantarum]MCW6116575.1 DUF2335 domain-containing protein [Lactiplantibacillus plantarum]
MTNNSPSEKPSNQSKRDSNTPEKKGEILDKLQELPDEEKEQIFAKLEMYSGPIPHPSILKGYEKLDPGAAKLIIENGVQESQHRRLLETKRQKRRGRMAWIVLFSLIAVTVMLLIGAFILIMNNHEIIGSLFGAGGFMTFLGSLVEQIGILSGNDDISTSLSSSEDSSENE